MSSMSEWKGKMFSHTVPHFENMLQFGNVITMENKMCLN